jgi:Zn-dependent peptidase ImmA (M78 family)
VLRSLDSREEVICASERLLRATGVGDALPTPVEDLIAAADLSRGGDDLFEDSTIEEAPAYLRGAIRKLRGKVHAVLDRRRRRVYVNPAISHVGRRRFRALHEVGHAILPSQNDPAHADNAQTLAWLTRVVGERDANQVASELMFQRERFTEMANEYEPSLAAVVELSQLFGSSIQASLRRFAEFHRLPVAATVLDISPVGIEPERYKRYEVVCSPSWETRFGACDWWPEILDSTVFDFVSGARLANTVPLVEWEGRWPDRENSPVAVRAHVISTTYYLLVLVWQPRRRLVRRRRELALDTRGAD